MRKLLIGAALCALFAAPALAGEPAKVAAQPITLSLAQMDKVTSGAAAAAAGTGTVAVAAATDSPTVSALLFNVGDNFVNNDGPGAIAFTK
jgi:hypothetical protein